MTVARISRIFRVALGCAALALIIPVTAGGAQAMPAKPTKRAPIAKIVDVKAKTTVHYSKNVFSGHISFPKVKSVFDNRRVPKKMVTKARKACYKMYAGGTRGKHTPSVQLVQRPTTWGGMSLNDLGETKFKLNGKWRVWGYDPDSTSELYRGNKVEIRGGMYDQFRNYRKTTEQVSFKYKGKRLANCYAFTAVYTPN